MSHIEFARAFAGLILTFCAMLFAACAVGPRPEAESTYELGPGSFLEVTDNHERWTVKVSNDSTRLREFADDVEWEFRTWRDGRIDSQRTTWAGAPEKNSYPNEAAFKAAEPENHRLYAKRMQRLIVKYE